MKIMVIVAHPNLDNSRANRMLMEHDGLYANGNADVRDLYKEYPNWTIDIEREQRLLLQYDRVVFQFPFYWYSCPPLLKKWMDDVLTFGWAFGPEGNKLKGKEFMLATTVAGLEQGYQAGGDNWYTASELLRPIQATLNRCKVHYLPAFVTYNVERVSDEALRAEADRYAQQVLAPAIVESRY